MNEAWVIEWWETCQECECLYQSYCNIVAQGFFTETSSPDRAALWLARDTFLEAMLDLIRDLYWHDLSNRPIGRWRKQVEAPNG